MSLKPLWNCDFALGFADIFLNFLTTEAASIFLFEPLLKTFFMIVMFALTRTVILGRGRDFEQAGSADILISFTFNLFLFQIVRSLLTSSGSCYPSGVIWRARRNFHSYVT